jgi:hypothetical protein
MQVITKEDTTEQVFEAVDCDLFLVVGNKNSLEYLSKDDDGIFKTERAWVSFINGNFVEYGDFISEPKESTLKKWAYALDKYKNKFCVQIGKDKFVQIDASELEFKFDYEVFYSRTSNFPSSIELYVTAKIKG